VRNNIYAVYLGCAGVLIGGIGLAYDYSAGDRQPREQPLFVQSGLAPAPAAVEATEWKAAEWPPTEGAVAFHDEMIALLTPPRRQEAQPQAANARGQEPAQQAAPPREAWREPANDQRQRSRTSRRRPAPDETVGVGSSETGPDDGRVVIRRDGRRVVVGRDRDEVDAVGRDGRRSRVDRRDRDDEDGPPPDTRRYRIEREAPVERRRVMPDPFRLFGGGW
jgi:hypothetical protein